MSTSDLKALLTTLLQGWADDSVFKGIDCSSRITGFESQQLLGGSQLSISHSSSWGFEALFWLLWVPDLVQYTGTHVGKTPLHIKLNKINLKSSSLSFHDLSLGVPMCLKFPFSFPTLGI